MINWDRIRELREEVGDDDLGEVVSLFCEEVEEVLDVLDIAPRDVLAAKLHFLKGSALNIGLEGVSRLCLAEESRLSADPGAAPDIAAIRAAYAAAKADLLDMA